MTKWAEPKTTNCLKCYKEGQLHTTYNINEQIKENKRYIVVSKSCQGKHTITSKRVFEGYMPRAHRTFTFTSPATHKYVIIILVYHVYGAIAHYLS